MADDRDPATQLARVAEGAYEFVGTAPHDLVAAAGWDPDVIVRALRRTSNAIAEARLREALRLSLDRERNEIPSQGFIRVTLRFRLEPYLWTKDVRMRTVPHVGEKLRDEYLNLLVKDVEHTTDPNKLSSEYPDVWIDVVPESEVNAEYLRQYGWSQ